VNPEVAASLSGGGFSNYFPRPAYQDGPVSAYLQSIGSMYSGLYKCVSGFGERRVSRSSQILSRSGRGYPDISAQAVNFQVVLGGKDATGSGTSCSAPVRSFSPRPSQVSDSPIDRPQQGSSPS
jgi:tripeptidyl-peptidase I